MIDNTKFYKNVRDVNGGTVATIEDILQKIKLGFWHEEINFLRNAPHDKKESIKKNLPLFTPHGIFEGRKDSGEIIRSGFLLIDIDHVSDLAETFQNLISDPYVYSCFVSCSGDGLAVLFNIEKNMANFSDMYDAIVNYLHKTYGIITDQSGRNLSRARFVSYDPNLYINKNARQWVKSLPKKSKKKISNFSNQSQKKLPFVESSFHDSIRYIEDNSVNICDSYEIWIRVGFALIDHFGEDGREYFHRISMQSEKYDYDDCDRKYNQLLKSNGSGISIGSLIYYFLEYDVPIYNKDDQPIVTEVSKLKKRNKSLSEIKKELVSENLIAEDDERVDSIFNQVDESTPIGGLSDLEVINDIIRKKFDLAKNTITNRYMIFDKSIGYYRYLKDEDWNDIYIYVSTKKEKVGINDVISVVKSNKTRSFNPIKEYLDKLEDTKELKTGLIDRLSDCIVSSQGLDGDLRRKYVKKWFLNIVASAFGEVPELLLILVGKKQGTGKTYFFRNLLPTSLEEYTSEHNLDFKNENQAGETMCENILVLNDEWSGKTRKQVDVMKQIISKRIFKYRKAYAREVSTMIRSAVLCGTTNDENILIDESGNRRIIPIQVESIDWNLYNSIDKELLLLEALKCYKDGDSYQVLSDEIDELKFHNEFAEGQTDNWAYEELILEHFEPCDRFDPEAEFMNGTMVCEYINGISNLKIDPFRTKMRTILTKICKNGEDRMLVGEQRKRGFWLKKKIKNDFLQPLGVNFKDKFL